jgi:hypothetical protein
MSYLLLPNESLKPADHQTRPASRVGQRGERLLSAMAIAFVLAFAAGVVLLP